MVVPSSSPTDAVSGCGLVILVKLIFRMTLLEDSYIYIGEGLVPGLTESMSLLGGLGCLGVFPSAVGLLKVRGHVSPCMCLAFCTGCCKYLVQTWPPQAFLGFLIALTDNLACSGGDFLLWRLCV